MPPDLTAQSLATRFNWIGEAQDSVTHISFMLLHQVTDCADHLGLCVQDLSAPPLHSAQHLQVFQALNCSESKSVPERSLDELHKALWCMQV